MRVGLCGHAHIPGVERFFRSGKNFLRMIVTAVTPAQLLNESANLAFRERTHEPIDRLTVPKGVYGGYRLDAKLLRDLRVLVDVDLDETYRAVGLVHGLLERGAQLLAGPAPRRPEIDDHGHGAAGVEHVGREGLDGAVFYIR